MRKRGTQAFWHHARMGSLRRMALVSLSVLVASACSSPPPPVPVEPDSVVRYLPRDYEAEFAVDYDALRDLDLLEWIDELPLAPGFFTSLASGYGCELDDLHYVRTGVRLVEQGKGARFDLVSVAVREPGRAAPMHASWKSARIAGHEGFEQDVGSGIQVVVFPQDGLAVAGERVLVEAGLADANGRPHPELAPLLAGERPVAQVAIGRFGRAMHELTGTVGWYWSDPADLTDFVRLRLLRGEEDHLVVEGLVRFQHGTTGLAEFESDARKALDSALARPQLRAIHALVRAVEVRRDGRDAILRVDLGTPRQAFGAMERLMLALASLRDR